MFSIDFLWIITMKIIDIRLIFFLFCFRNLCIIVCTIYERVKKILKFRMHLLWVSFNFFFEKK